MRRIRLLFPRLKGAPPYDVGIPCRARRGGRGRSPASPAAKRAARSLWGRAFTVGPRWFKKIRNQAGIESHTRRGHMWNNEIDK